MSVSMDELINNIDALANADIANELLTVAAEAYADAWRESIQSHGHVKTGKLFKGVTVSDPKRDFGNLSKVVYSKGKRPGSKLTNAQLAYILNFGRNANQNGRSALTGDHFVDEAQRAAESVASQAVQRRLDELTKNL